MFGYGYAAAYPELVIAVMNAAPSDWAASWVAIERVAEALLVGSDEQMFGVNPQILGRRRGD